MTAVVGSSQFQFSICSPQTILQHYNSLSVIASGCIAMTIQWEQLLLHSLLKVNEKITQPHLKVPGIVIDNDLEGRVDVRDVDNIKVVKNAGKKGKKGAKKKSNDEKKEKIDEGKAAERKAEEEERLRKWEEDWDKKLKAQEALEDKTCCMSKGFCLKPKTQSNIWINITKEKTLQDIQLYFKHVPVPKPKPPPLPKLKKEEEPVEPAPTKEKKPKRTGKKSAKKK